jgi:hypothetical protein
LFAISASGGSHQPLTIFDWLIKISARKIPAAVQIVTPKCSELTERQPRFQSRFKSAISAPVYPAYIVRFSSRQFIEFSIEPPDKSSRQPLGPTAHRRPRRADHAHGTSRDGPRACTSPAPHPPHGHHRPKPADTGTPPNVFRPYCAPSAHRHIAKSRQHRAIHSHIPGRHSSSAATQETTREGPEMTSAPINKMIPPPINKMTPTPPNSSLGYLHAISAATDPARYFRRHAAHPHPFQLKFPGMGNVIFFATTPATHDILTMAPPHSHAPTPNPIEPIVGKRSIRGHLPDPIRRRLSPCARP